MPGCVIRSPYTPSSSVTPSSAPGKASETASGECQAIADPADCPHRRLKIAAVVGKDGRERAQARAARGRIRIVRQCS